MEWDYLLRVVVAGLCGALIGYERKNRMKEAGIRTHFVVALGASLMMVISKYGFQDQIGWSNLSLDPSRVAAQVVSGVGFLGAGMIFMQKQTVKGLTTAAGVWATAGMGMAIGSGLYLLGIGVTLVILIAQIVLHTRYNWLATPRTEHLTMQIRNEQGSVAYVQQALQAKGIALLSFHVESRGPDESELFLDLQIKLPGNFGLEQLMPFIQEISTVKTIEVQPH